VRATLLDAYARLAITQPDVRWVYGETGWPRGGAFPPHQTHQNGLSVDFMVPVRNAVGRSERLPTWPWQRFGYALDFDSAGRGRGAAAGLTIDFAALAAHLATLADVAQAHGLAVDVVILAPELERRVLATPEAAQFRGRIRFSRRPPWVRHDEHYHVNFRLLRLTGPGTTLRR
jgi:penicillin-insensitive murein endopeptidase